MAAASLMPLEQALQQLLELSAVAVNTSSPAKTIDDSHTAVMATRRIVAKGCCCGDEDSAKLWRAVPCCVLQVSATYLVADMAEEDSPWAPYFK